jgi:hypothetical protein
MALEVLDFAFVLFGCTARGESSEVFAAAGFGVLLSGVELRE